MRGPRFPSLLDVSLLICGSLCCSGAFADPPSAFLPRHLPAHSMHHPSYTHRPLISASRSRIMPSSPIAFLASWNPQPRAQLGCSRLGGVCGLRAEATPGQDRAPLVEALEAAAGRIGPNFFLPGHQQVRQPPATGFVHARAPNASLSPVALPAARWQGRGFPSLLTRPGGMFGGNADILRYDLPEDVEDLDSLRDPSGAGPRKGACWCTVRPFLPSVTERTDRAISKQLWQMW